MEKKENNIKVKKIENELSVGSMLGLELIFGDDFPLFEALQTNLELKQVNLQQNILKSNLENSYILKSIYGENIGINSGIKNINDEITILKNLIENKEKKEERESAAKEIMFNLNQEYKKLKNYKDNMCIYYVSNLLLNVITENNLTTKDFNLIEEKEYFSNIVENIKKNLKIANSEEKKEIDRFLKAYYLLLKMKKEINSDKYIRNRVVLEYTGEEIVCPVRNELLDLEDEIIRIYKSGIFPDEYRDNIRTKLLKHINKIDEIPLLYDKLINEKEKYETLLIKYKNYKQYVENKDNELKLTREYNEKKDIIKELEKKVNLFLDIHNDFYKHLQKIDITFKSIEIEKRSLDIIINNEISELKCNIISKKENAIKKMKNAEKEREIEELQEKRRNNFTCFSLIFLFLIIIILIFIKKI